MKFKDLYRKQKLQESILVESENDQCNELNIEEDNYEYYTKLHELKLNEINDILNNNIITEEQKSYTCDLNFDKFLKNIEQSDKQTDLNEVKTNGELINSRFRESPNSKTRWK